MGLGLDWKFGRYVRESGEKILFWSYQLPRKKSQMGEGVGL